MRSPSETRFALIVLVLAGLLAAGRLPCAAQDDPSDIPLGDIARNLRKKAPPPAQSVIDDDNLSTALSQIESKRASGSSLKYLMAGDSKGFQVSAPDATCSLSFSANAKALLSSQYSQMELPTADVDKLRGPATIEGDALTVSLFNGTDWHVSEVAVALTIVRKKSTLPMLLPGAELATNLAPEAPDMAFDPVRPEKKPDLTVIYHMRAVAPPLSRASFSSPLNLDLAPGDEWHWAIVQARGYPPQDRRPLDHMDQNPAETSAPVGEPSITGDPSPPTQQIAPTPASLNEPH